MISDHPIAPGSSADPIVAPAGDRQRLDQLSPRQLQVLQLLATGASARDIAEQLQIRPATVKQHVGLVYRKLGVSNRVQAANVYLRATISRDSPR